MKNIIFIILLLFACNISLAQEVIVDIHKAKFHAAEKNHLQAVQILVPCLKDNIQMESDLLEECLYWGGVIFKQAFSLENNHINDPLLREFQKLGLDVTFEKWAPGINNNNFFQKMNRHFSQGKYEDVLAFENISWAYNELVPILKTANDFETYRQDYLESRHYAEATLNLAHIYDNLWEDIGEPLSDENYHESYLRSDDPIRDAQDAEHYRNKSLQLYEEYLSISVVNVKNIKHRYEELKNRKPSHRFYILND